MSPLVADAGRVLDEAALAVASEPLAVPPGVCSVERDVGLEVLLLPATLWESLLKVLEILNLAILAVPLLPAPDDTAAPLPVVVAPPFGRASSGKYISMIPIIPPPWGFITRICGLPSSEVPKVTCPSPPPPPLAARMKLAKMFCKSVGSMVATAMDC